MEFQYQMEPQQDPSQIAAGGCLISIPVLLMAGFRWALKAAEAKEHALAHQIENVELEDRPDIDGANSQRMPVEESLRRFVTGLKHTTAPFEKMNARFDPKIHAQETSHLQSLKTRLKAQSEPTSDTTKALVTEAEQILARYAPA